MEQNRPHELSHGTIVAESRPGGYPVAQGGFKVQSYLNVSQGARYLGMGEKAFRKWLERGRIPYRKLGRRILIPAREFEQVLEALPGKTVSEVVAAAEE